jgi:hypothetical protein
MANSSPYQKIALELLISGNPQLLRGLDLWLHLGLLNDTQVRMLCAHHLQCPIHLEVRVLPQHPNFQTGVEQWQQLGLLTLTQAQWLLPAAQTIAQAPPPIPVSQPSASQPPAIPAPTPVNTAPPPGTEPFPVDWSQFNRPPAPTSESPRSDRQPQRQPLGQPQRQPQVAPPARRGWVPQMLQALMDEISVLWLLFLGVFLVVVSSGILAASQWDAVSPAGQYGILFGYTVAFWAVSFWVSRRENLRLTANTLQITSLLIIPVNFWMIDSFNLIQGGLGLGVAIAAGVILSLLMGLILQPQSQPRWGSMVVRETGWVSFASSVLLAWCHWGWQRPGVGLASVYLGVVTASVAVGYCHRWPGTRPPAPSTPEQRFARWLLLTPLYGGLLLLLRAVWIAKIPLPSLSVAFGLAGWILCWIARQPMMGPPLVPPSSRLGAPAMRTLPTHSPTLWSQSGWLMAGISLLLFGRWHAEAASSALPALIISGLGLWIAGDRLLRRWQPIDLWMVVLIGLQTAWPLYGLIPPATLQRIIQGAIAITGSTWMPEALISLVGLPYLWFLLAGATFFRRRRKPTLARLSEQMALVLGAGLALVSAGNPACRTLYLTLILATLILRFRRRAKRSAFLIHLSHGVGLAAIASAVNLWVPDLPVRGWVFLGLGTMALEWGLLEFGWLTQSLLATGIANRKTESIWQQSLWGYGLVLAILSYLGLLQGGSWLNPTRPLSQAWEYWGWVIPMTLTAQGYRNRVPQAAAARALAIIAVPAMQLVSLPVMPTRLGGFFLGTLLLAMNAQRMQLLFPVAITLGFGLCLLGAGVWEFGLQNAPAGLAILVPLSSAGLLAARHCLMGRRAPLVVLYRRALHAWSLALDSALAFVLGGIALGSLVVQSFFKAELPHSLGVGAGVMVLATLYRLSLNPTAGGLLGLALILESAIWVGASYLKHPLDAIAIGTLLAGWGLLLAHGIVRRLNWGPEIFRRHDIWQMIPIGYSVLGLLWGHHDFEAHTGIYTMVAAMLALAVGRQRTGLRGVTYCAIAALSFGAYELLVYQLQQIGGDHSGDALVLFALLATGVALGDRILTRWSEKLLKLTRNQFLPVAHLHWLFATVFLGTALVLPMSRLGEGLWAGNMLLLAAYALQVGRQWPGIADFGIGQLLAVIGFGLRQVLPLSQLLHWGAAIATGMAFILYVLPWQRWGWPPQLRRRLPLVLPIGGVVLTLPGVGLSSLLLAGAWYIWLGQRISWIRLSYVGVVLADWALYRLVDRLVGITPIWLAMGAGGTLLFIAQVDPALRVSDRKELRHWFRCIAFGLMALTALVESDAHILGAALTVVGAILLGLAGLALRMRSALYVGTLTFVIKILRILWLFVAKESLLLWAFGIVLGLVLIWIAATFESRRSQAIAALSYWSDALEEWQ